MRHVQPKFNNLVCSLNEAEFMQTQTYLALDAGVELLIAAVTYIFLRRHGFTPLRTLCGLIAKHFPSFLAIAACSHAFFLPMQHSHLGMDPSFVFPWMRGHTTRWGCGLKWSL